MHPHKSAVRIALVLAGIFAIAVIPAWTEEKPRKDSTGDPLPEGALARLGTTRWRHTAPVKFVAYVNGGKEIVSSADDGVFYVWDVESGKEVRHFGEALKGFPNQPLGPIIGWQDPNRTFQIALSDDGKTLAVGAPDQKIHIWEVNTGKELRSFAHAHQQFCASLAFTPDGKSLISRGPDQRIKVWDPADGKSVREFMEGGGQQFWGNGSLPLVASPDSKLLAGASATVEQGRGLVYVLRIWDIKEGKELKLVKESTLQGQVMNIWPAFSADSKNVAWPKQDGGIAIYEAATGKEVQKCGDANSDQRMLRLQYSPDGKALAALTSDQTVILYDPSTGKKSKEIGEEPPGPFGKAMAKGLRTHPLNFSLGHSLAFSPDGKTIAQGWGNVVRQWNLENGKGNDIYAGHCGDIMSMFVSSDGKTALTAANDNSVRKWDLSTGKQSEVVDLPGDGVTTLLADANRAVVRDDNGVRVVDLKTGKSALKLDSAGGAGTNPFTGLPGQMSLSSDGKTLATSSPDQVVRAFNLETGKQINGDKDLSFADQQGRQILYAVGASPDGTSVAVQLLINELVPFPGGGFNQQAKFLVRLYDLESGKALWENSNVISGQCRSLTFSPDARNLAVINGDNTTVMVFEAATGKERWRFSLSNIVAHTFSADSRFIVAGNFEGAVKVFDIRAGKEIASFQMPTGRVRSVAFTPDASAVISGGADGTALVWNIKDQVQKSSQLAEVDAETVKRLWADLGDADAAKAYRAISALSGSSKTALPWLKEQVKPAKGEDNSVIEKLVADLDSDDFATRQLAFQELGKVGAQAEPALRKCLAGKPSLEVRQHVEELLEKLTPGLATALSPEVLRQMRAMEVIESLRSPEAREVLVSLAKGAEGAKLTKDAAAALRRLPNEK